MDIYKRPVAEKRKKQPPGRSPLWTQEFMYMVASKVVDEGMKYREAAELFGVSHGSINAWRKAYQSGKLGPGSKEPKKTLLKLIKFLFETLGGLRPTTLAKSF